MAGTGGDVAALVVAMSAQLTQFEKDMARAGDLADHSVRAIEDRFKAANISFPGLDDLVGKVEKLATAGGIAALIAQFHELNAEVAKIGESAERVGLTTDEFQKFRFAIVATGGSLEQADNFLDTFSRKIAEAATGTGSLYNFLRVNNVALKDANGQLLPLSVLLDKYSDLVKNTASPQDRLNEAFMVAGRQAGPAVVAALSQGADGLRRFGEQAQSSGTVIDRELIDRARKINTEYEKMKLVFQTTAQEIAVNTWDILARSIESVSSALKEFAEQFEAVRNLKDRVANGSTDLGGSGFDTPGVGFVPGTFPGQQPPQVTISKASQPSPIPQPRPNPGQDLGGTGLTKQYNEQANAFDKLIKNEEKRIELLGVEQEAVGKTVGAATQMRTQVELENAAKEQNIPLTQARIAAIENEASRAGAAAQALDDYKRQWASLNSAAQFAGDQLVTVLDGLEQKTTSLADAAKNLENSLLHALNQAAIMGSGPLAGLLGTASNVPGGTGGLLGLLTGGFGGGKATGGDIDPGKFYVVGENGPELLGARGAATIVPNEIASRTSSGSGWTPRLVVNNYGAQVDQPTMNNNGDLELTVRAVTRDEMASGRTNGIQRQKYGQAPRLKNR